MNLEAIQFLIFNIIKLFKRNAPNEKIIVNEYEPVFFHTYFQKSTSNPHEILKKYPGPLFYWTHLLDINTNYDLEEQYISKEELEDLAVRNDDTFRILKIASLRYTVTNPLADRRNHLSAIKLGFSFFDNLPSLTSEENILKIAADKSHFRFGYIFNERQFQLDYLEDLFEARIVNFIENELLRLEADFEADILQERLSLQEMERHLHHYHIIRNQINSILNLHRRKENPHDLEWMKIREKSLNYYSVTDLWDKVDQHLTDITEFIAEYKDRKRNNMFWILAITFSLNVLFDIIHTMFLPLDNAENLVEYLAAFTILAVILITWWRYRNLDKTKQFSHLS